MFIGVRHTKQGVYDGFNMKAILLLVGLCALALATPTPTPTKYIQKKYQISDPVQLERQLNILRLFKYVTQPLFYKDLLTIAHTYNPETKMNLYTKSEYVIEFMKIYHHTMVPKGHMFSLFDYQHLKQAITLFKMFYYAKDFDTFFNTAVWAREYVNEYLFIYSFTVALIHRPDTFGFVIPPIYDVFPYYFFNSDVIYKAQYYKQIYHGEYPKTDPNYVGYTITTNYSEWYMDIDREQYVLKPLLEDVGFNDMLRTFYLYYPYWMDPEEFGLVNDRSGELYYAFNQMMLARYTSERLSFSLPDIPVLSTVMTLEPGYYSTLEYPNGIQFPSRPPHTPITWDTSYNHYYYNFTNSYTKVIDYFRRMRDALSLGFVYTDDGTRVSLHDEKGLEIFANMVQGNPSSPYVSYYGILEMYVRHILGYGPTPIDKDHVVPSVVHHYETALRDPAYWYFVKFIVYFFQEFKMRQDHHYYTVKDLQFEGVKVENIKVDRLVTYFEYGIYDLSQAVFYNPTETEPFHVRLRQPRLTHKPFTYTIDIQSDKAVESVVRVYAGPKYDSYGRVIDFNENRLNFYIIDKFVYQLQVGKTSIVRDSKQTFTVTERTSYWQLYKRVLGATKKTEEFWIDGSETYWGLPNRLILPHGTTGGMPYQFFVIVTPYDKTASNVQKGTEERVFPRVGTGFYIYDKLHFGFPFDLPVKDVDVWQHISNYKFQEVKVYHKATEESLNVSV
ncbi:hypothetical protein AMK59_4478 [Oryctes borbonicus]|uniref:Uncharacterized protein n=1 Tax=Oryctes borbonicus TaxID=1629725 RepID=A0A0T6B8F5_9SCAR|nr:hypothetical protein AMK59_4478 [Oryctes borbonicus]